MKRSDISLVLSCAVFLSLNMVFVRRARADFPVPLFGLLQMSLVSVFLLANAFIKEGRAAFRGIREDLKPALTIGVLACGITYFNFLGFGNSTATAGAVLQRTDVLFTLLIGWILAGERFKTTDLLFIAVLVAGVLILIEFNPVAFAIANPYNLTFVVAAVGMSVTAFLIRYKIKKIGWQIIGFLHTGLPAVFYLLLVLFVVRDQSVKALRETPQTVAWVLCGATALVLYLMFYYAALKKMQVWLVRSLLLCVPVFTISMEYFMFGTVLTVKGLVGILLVTAGVFGLTMNRKT